MPAAAVARPPARMAGPGFAALVLALCWLTAFSARSNTISVGPVLPLIQHDLGLSFAQAGLLFAVPVLMMGVFSIPSGLIIARLGVKPALLISLALMAVGGGFRAEAQSAGSLFLCTAVTGAGVGLVQPTLPRLVKDFFQRRTGVATGVYSTGFTVGATVSAALAIPVLVPLSGGLSWRGPFIFWAMLVVGTIAIWLFVPAGRSRTRESLAPFARIFRSRLCWLASGLFMTQSVIFYTLNSWLTSYYQSLGFDLNRAALTVALLSAGSILFGFSGPALSDLTGRRPLLIGASFGVVGAVLGLWLCPTFAFWLWPVLLGGLTAVLFTVGFVLPVDVCSADEVGAFTGLMLTVGYGGAVIGPPLIGFLRDVTSSHLAGLLTMLAISLGEVWLALALPETKQP